MKLWGTLNMDGVPWERKSKMMWHSLQKCTGLKNSLLQKSSTIRDLLHYLVKCSLTILWQIAGKTYSSWKGEAKKGVGGGEGRGSQNQPGELFLVLTFSEWWQLIRATALVVGDLCSQPVVPCYWRELGEWIKSLSLKSSPLQSTAESGP